MDTYNEDIYLLSGYLDRYFYLGKQTNINVCDSLEQMELELSIKSLLIRNPSILTDWDKIPFCNVLDKLRVKYLGR